jgi:sugar lactone lactonase YvrE
LVRFPINPDGKAGAIETLIPDGILPSGDGMAFDPASGAVFIADPRSNSIHRWHATEGLSIFTRRSQTAFVPGSLDSPVDVVIRDGNLLISNWTSAKRECVISTLPLTNKP